MNLECNIQLENCLIYLNDEHWSYIVRKLNYVDKISLGRTCSRFFNLISTKEICYLNEQFKIFFESSLVLDDYITYVCGRFRLQFYHHYFLKVDRLYLAYFLSILKEKLTCRLICGHMFWCHRKNVLDSECKICYQVFRCDEDPSKKIYIQMTVWISGTLMPKTFMLKKLIWNKTFNLYMDVNILKISILENSLLIFLVL